MINRLYRRAVHGVSTWRDASLKPLRTPQFKMLWLAAMVSHFGATIQTVAASWTMTTLDPSPELVALVQTAAMAPTVFLALPAGALADTTDRRLMMIISQVVGLLAAGSLAILSFTGGLTPKVLLMLTAVIGSAMALHLPSWQASFNDILPRAALPAAVGLNSLGYNLARSLGPAIGGAVLATTGAATAFAINALSFTGLIGALLAKPIPRPATDLPPESFGRAMLAGLRYAAMSSAIRTILFRGGLFGIGASAIFSLSPLVAKGPLNGGPVLYGLLLGALGMGALLAAALSAFAHAKLGNESLVWHGSLGFAFATLLLGISSSTIFSIACMFIAGISLIFVWNSFATSVQLSSPRWVVGRAVSLHQITTTGGFAVGAYVWGVCASRVGIEWTFVAAASLLIGSAFAGQFARLPSGASSEVANRDQRTVSIPQVALDGRTGPVAIMVEYEVPTSEATSFLKIMHSIGHIRRRDGARNWMIWQDADRPEIWVERFENATWTDYLRQVSRTTVADEAILDRARVYRSKEQFSFRRMVGRPVGSAPLG